MANRPSGGPIFHAPANNSAIMICAAGVEQLRLSGRARLPHSFEYNLAINIKNSVPIKLPIAPVQIRDSANHFICAMFALSEKAGGLTTHASKSFLSLSARKNKRAVGRAANLRYRQLLARTIFYVPPHAHTHTPYGRGY